MHFFRNIFFDTGEFYLQKNEFELLLIIYTLFFSYFFGSDASSSSRKHGLVEFFSCSSVLGSPMRDCQGLRLATVCTKIE